MIVIKFEKNMSLSKDLKKKNKTKWKRMVMEIPKEEV